MNSASNAKIKEHVMTLLSSGSLGTREVEQLVDVLRPKLDAEKWPAIEVVLCVAQHPTVHEALNENRLPEQLGEALAEALAAVVPLLGKRFFGPLSHQVERFQECYAAEENIYERVYQRLNKEITDQERVQIFCAYIETRGVPLFMARFRQLYPELMRQAEDIAAQGKEFDVFCSVPGLVEVLRFDDDIVENEDSLFTRLVEELVAKCPTIERLVGRALRSHDAEIRLVAGALAVHFRHHHIASELLDLVIVADIYAPQFAVFAGVLDKEMTCHILSQYLVDAAYQNPEEPDAQMTAERVNALVAARCVLPKVGSPLVRIAQNAFPEHGVVGVVERCWGAVCREP